MKLNFKHFNLDDENLFVNKVWKIVVYLVVYVDDLFMIGNNEKLHCIHKERVKEMIWDDILGKPSLLLRHWSDPTSKLYIPISKEVHGEFLNNFGMFECNPLSNPMEQNIKLASK